MRHYKHLVSRVVEIGLIIILPVMFTIGFGLYQTVRPERIGSTATPALESLVYEDVRMQTEDGLQIAGWYIPSTAKQEVKKTIIVLHGYPADKGDLLRRMSFLVNEYNLLYIDFRYFGESEGSMTSVGAKERLDLLAAVEYAKSQGAEKIGVYGFSMGGAVALMATEITDDIDAVISESSYADLSLMAEGIFVNFGPFRKALAWMMSVTSKVFLEVDVKDVSPRIAAENANIPILVIHSEADKVIAFKNAELLEEALKDNPDAEFMFDRHAAHGEATAAFTVKIQNFFAKHL